MLRIYFVLKIIACHKTGNIMSWKTINNTGYFLEKSHLPQEKGMKKTATFLHQMTKQFANNCSRYYDVVDDLPFTYQERQIHSMLLPAIAKISQATLVEQPIKRKSNGNSQHGWIDYWVYYEPFVFMIELKYGIQAINYSKVWKRTNSSWGNANEQIRSISKSSAKSIWTDTSKIIKIAAMIVLYYQSSTKADKLRPLDKTEVIDAHEFLVNNISPTPNWNCLWSLHKKFQKVNDFKNDAYEIYPSVGIVAKVTTL